MGIIVPETFLAYKKYNKIVGFLFFSYIEKVDYSGRNFNVYV